MRRRIPAGEYGRGSRQVRAATSAKICKGLIKNSVESHNNILLYCMTDTFSKIKEELSLYYLDVTDDELETMTQKLITFFKLSAKALQEAKKAENSLNDIDDTKS